MCVEFFVDENIGQSLVDGLRAIGYDNIEHCLETFEPGTPDEEWLEYIGQERIVLITKDKRIRKNILEKQTIREYGIVAFFLGGSKQSTKQIALQLQHAWPKMENQAKKQLKTGVAGAFIIRAQGKTIVRIDIEQRFFN